MQIKHGSNIGQISPVAPQSSQIVPGDLYHHVEPLPEGEVPLWQRVLTELRPADLHRV